MAYEIIVVGGGHAGCEAALACARRGHNTLLITKDLKTIAKLPCNPAIGGSAKGIVVREIDALGGEMGRNADKTHFQIKLLNRSKGPAVRSLRAQVDKIEYPKEMLKTIKQTKNLTLKTGFVIDFIIKEKTIKGVKLDNNKIIESKAVILTTGTDLNSYIIKGKDKTSIIGDNKLSCLLSINLERYGFEMITLKTSTPPLLKKDSIAFTELKVVSGDNQYLSFNFDHTYYYDILNQEKCYLTYTNKETHDIILKYLKANKQEIQSGIEPRYCPSIEAKIIRFKDKERHHLFLEPESKSNDNIYLQGLYNSLPESIQTKAIHSIKGLEKAVIKKYGYAVQYEAIQPTQLKLSLETKIINNLWLAGQINGSSGYEEAAAQGLMAGINASLKVKGEEPFILKRNEAYIGVLIDDLVTKGVQEPYRLLTSRAEYRLLLRGDNADLRLKPYAYKYGLIPLEKYTLFQEKQKDIELLTKILKTRKLPSSPKVILYDYLKQNSFDLELVKSILTEEYKEEVWEQILINSKYEGYIKKMNKEVVQMLKNETKQIPFNLDYNKVPNLAIEARQKLTKIKPLSLGQAMRISGINPSDLTMLSIYLRKYYPYE